jgi:long-chain acyl-CoA synthetase
MITGDLLLSFKNNTAVITDKGETLSYGELYNFAEELYQQIGKRCLVFSLCKNEPGSFAGYVSFLTKKIVPLLLDASLETGYVQDLLALYKPGFLWLPTDRLKDFPANPVVYTVQGYALIASGYNDSFPLHDQLALLFTTSGSTGSPKLVRISYENIRSNAEAIAEYLSISREERPITVLPMHYSYGLSVINSHLLKGATILLTGRSLMEKEFWSFLQNEKASSLSGVPYTYEILEKLRFSRMNLPSLLTLTQAGGKLNETLSGSFAKFCEESGKKFFVMYGQTEATARMSYLPSELSVTKNGSIGKAIPGGALKLIDEKGAVIDQNNMEGELVYYGKNVSMGYALDGKDLIKEDERKGVLYTHDLAKRDDDGFYYITGRKNRFVKLFGIRVGLDETEQILKNIVSDCACTGEDDHLVIFITDPLKQEEVLAYISMKTGINRKAFSVRHVQMIPKNASGKTIYTKLAIS